MSIFVFYKTSMSIFYNFYKIWTSLQFLSRFMSDSTTFKVALSHFVFYPCGALFILGPIIIIEPHCLVPILSTTELLF